MSVSNLRCTDGKRFIDAIRRYALQRAVVVLLFAFSIAQSNKLLASTYEVEGRLEHEVRSFSNPGAPEVFSQNVKFRAVFGDTGWFIHTETVPFTGRYLELFYDGRDLYQVYGFGVDSVNQSGSEASATIEEINTPAAGPLRGELVWLAYCSSAFLPKAASKGQLNPVWLLNDPSLRQKAYKVPATWTLSAEGILLDILYFDDGNVWFKDNAGVSMRERRDPPFSEGFLRASFKTLSTTNYGGAAIPLQARYEGYIPNPLGKTSADVICSSSAEIYTESIKSGNLQSLDRQVLSPTTRVDDKRFWSTNVPLETVRYMLTNGVWLDREDQRIQRLYQAELQRLSIHPVRPPMRKWPVFALFALATAIPLYFVIRTKNE